METSADRPNAERLQPRQRSAVTNGRRLFVDGDDRSAWSRRYRDLVTGHVSDLGGRDVLSEAQVSLIKRAVAIEIELERMEGLLSTGGLVDLDLLGRLAGHLRRIFETLGLERRARTVMSLGQILEAPRG